MLKMRHTLRLTPLGNVWALSVKDAAIVTAHTHTHTHTHAHTRTHTRTWSHKVGAAERYNEFPFYLCCLGGLKTQSCADRLLFLGWCDIRTTHDPTSEPLLTHT